LPLLISFTYVPAAIGAIGCMAIVRWVPSARLLWVLAAIVLGAVVLGVAGISLVSGAEADFLTPAWFQEMLNRLRVTEHRWLPSWWLTSGLFAAARREVREGGLFLLLMISNALFFRLLAIGAAQQVYRAGFDHLHARRVPPRRGRTGWMDRAVNCLMRGLPDRMRLIVVKDFRLFRRDPVQWSQSLIFLGLLTLYFSNIRRLTYDHSQIVWVNLISFLNVFVVGLLLSTFTTRFIFPMISLEGGRFWVLGLVPLGRGMLLWSKFTFAVGGSLVPCALLILLSDLMLRVPPILLGIHQLICVLLSFGLAGIAVGLGARWPNLREQSPARIAAGFGGTLNLVLSTLYIVAIVLLTALPCHFYLGTQTSESAGQLAYRLRLIGWLDIWVVGGVACSILLGVLATLAPMYIGIRALRRMEF
jgi:ABC-2 type transport system permease protein